MKTDHAHVEAAVAASLVVAVLAVVDLFVNVADGHAAKVPAYFGVFVAIYLVARILLKKAWR